MLALRLIERKRDGGRIDAGEWRALANAYAAGHVPDYQMAAFLMACYLRGLDRAEIGRAFDNDEVLHLALRRLRGKIEYAHVAYQFLPPVFTLAQLRAVYEVILGRQIDPTNFRRRVEAAGTIVPTGEVVSGGRHRPPALYRCAEDPAVLVKTMRPRRALKSQPEPHTTTEVTR